MKSDVTNHLAIQSINQSINYIQSFLLVSVIFTYDYAMLFAWESVMFRKIDSGISKIDAKKAVNHSLLLLSFGLINL